MFETELKFQVPSARWAALQKAVATASAQRTRLQAIYLETPGHDLAAAGLALRLRKEGRVWVQTLKGRGDGLMQRLEHEVRLGPRRGLPAVDPALHDGTPAGQALRAVLAKARDEGRSDDLRMLYRTDIVRLHRRLRHGGAVVEVALDSGAIYAEAADADTAEDRLARPALRTPVAEVEFELISGPPAALAALAGRWVQRFDLWWDVRTKSERGFRLALARAEVPATRAQPVQWPPGDALAPALAAMLQSALSQALPNLAELAGAAKPLAMAAPTPAAGDHLHQLRVALRRLRTALALYGGWAPDPAVPAALQERWQVVFAEMGAARDADVLAAVWLPRLQAAGAPALPPDTGRATLDVGERLRRADISVLLMDTLGLCLQLAAPEPAAVPVNGDADADADPGQASSRTAPSRKDAAHAVLQKAWRRAWADARQFATAPVAQRHRARKRLKQLRYAAEFAEPVLPSKPAKRWRRVMTQALQALGDYNDLHIAREHYARLAEQHPQAWYAVGWLAAQVPSASEAAGKAIKALKSHQRPWRKR